MFSTIREMNNQEAVTTAQSNSVSTSRSEFVDLSPRSFFFNEKNFFKYYKLKHKINVYLELTIIREYIHFAMFIAAKTKQK